VSAPGGPLGFDEDEAAPEARTRAAPASPAARLPPGASRYGWFVGILVVLLLAYVSLNTLRSRGPGSRGPRPGSPLPAFAAPLATSALSGDVNVARAPDQGAAGNRPACQVRGPDVVNSCQLAARGPVVLAFMAARGSPCTRELDYLQQVGPRHPGLEIAAVAIRGDRTALRALIRARGWRFPVAYDRDGVLANVYGVAVCPQITYALPGGRVQGTSIGELGPPALDRRLTALERAARRQGWVPPATG
jgi:hypothetical protein